MIFVPVAVPQSESELCVMMSLLDAEGLAYFVLNRGFGGLYPGMPLHLYNNRQIMVHATQAQEAFDLLSVFRQHSDDFETLHKLRWRDKLRVLAEALLGHWCFPVRRRVLDVDSPT